MLAAVKDQKPIISSHLGRQVVLGRRRVSPHVLGPKRMGAILLLDSLPTPPVTRDWIKAAEDQTPGGDGDLGVMMNDSLGCCTIAGPGHAKQIWTANNGPMVTPPDSVILADYERVDGYVQGDPSTDQGGIIANVMSAWKAPGGVAGSEIEDFIPVTMAILDHVRKCIDRYGVCNIGLELPLIWQNSTTWSVQVGAGAPAEPGSWGGHDVVLGAYDPDGFYCVTWGRRQRITNAGLLTYADEGFAPLSKLWIGKSGSSPAGYAEQTLDQDLQAVAA